MIVYNSTKETFLKDVKNDAIEDIVLASIKERLKISVGKNEISSWQNSLKEMYFILDDSGIPADSGIAIEYRIPQTSKRIDFIITGADENNNEQVMLIEMKQWSSVEASEKDAVVKTRLGGALVETSHPSYQVWSYSMLMENFNATVYEDKISLNPSAYLHNYKSDGVIDSQAYSEYINRAPLFFKGDKEKLRDFIKRFIKHGDKKNTMLRIDNGKIKPSKNLADNLESMLKGNKEFIMIDEQKIAFETALLLAKLSSDNKKRVLIISGGPGTGKSIVAINLIVALTNLDKNVRYVTKNSAPRTVYESKLTGSFKKSYISNMFTGSGSFIDLESNSFDALIVDEAHRLNEKSGMFKNLGENQIKEIINSAKLSVFFIDEDQQIAWNDIGTKDEIIKWASELGAEVYKANGQPFIELSSQFRCNGSDGYLSWLDNTLQIRETANTTLEKTDYDFKVFTNPNELRDAIFEKNKINNKARLVAGYCWDWDSKKDMSLYDVKILQYGFEMRWNLASDGNLWILKPESVSEVGCIHTCQGLEVDYIGVIIGNDLIVRDGIVITDPKHRSRSDSTIKGYGRDSRIDPEAAAEKMDRIIKNTYRTLMSRGSKGCYIYCTDEETSKYFSDKLINNIDAGIVQSTN